MEWQDEGVIIGQKQHGETGLIVELMTRAHGRHKGLVRGGRQKKQMPLCQMGNVVRAHWQARLSEHMGQYRLEAVEFAAARLMQSRLSLYALQNAAAYLRLLPERDPHSGLYDSLPLLFAHFDAPLLAGEIFMRFELRLLEELGFGLDLERCAATGKIGRHAAPAGAMAEQTELTYVSPKSGRAVSRAGGAPWKDKLLPLPPFLLAPEKRAADFSELEQAFRLTGFFLTRNVWEPRGLAAPPFRAAFLRCLQAALENNKENY